MSAEYTRQRRMIRFAVILLMTLAVFCIGHDNSYATSSAPTAKGKVNAKSGIYLKAKASTSAKKIVKVKDNANLTIIKEVYLKSNKTSTKYKWYYVKSSSGKKGYIPASKVDGVKYTEVDGVTTDALNYRVGPDTDM
ncbi:MAG: SH3 domain-containing protein, partial [Mogibacterium sp.]|nr:SH3 domain-containing protein [Mogibacterium sp.]